MKMYLPLLSAIESAAQSALAEVADATLERSNALIPEDTGETKQTGFSRTDDLTAQVGYTSFIARLQHENLENEHPTGGQAKFLEIAANEMRPLVGPTIAAHLRGKLGA